MTRVQKTALWGAWMYSIIHLIYVFEYKIGQPSFERIELKKVIVIIQFSRDWFTLRLNNCVYSIFFLFKWQVYIHQSKFIYWRIWHNIKEKLDLMEKKWYAYLKSVT